MWQSLYALRDSNRIGATHLAVALMVLMVLMSFSVSSPPAIFGSLSQSGDSLPLVRDRFQNGVINQYYLHHK